MSKKNKPEKLKKGGSVSLAYLTKEGFRNIRSNKLMSLASVAVLMSCLVIIGAAFLLFININVFLGDISDQNVVMVFITDDTPQEEVEALGNEIKSISNVGKCRFIPKEEAFAKQLESLGSAAPLFEGMDDIPLPDAYEVTLKDMEIYDTTVRSISELDNIDTIRQNRDFAKQLTNLKKTAGTVSIAVIAMLLIVSLFIISNTVRVTMYNRRLEIRIMKSVGATKWFIRWPFMIEGMVLGIIAGLLSLLIVWGLYELLSNAVTDMLNVFSAKPVAFMDYIYALLIAFVGTGIVTGVLGSALSMNKYLKEQDYDSDNVSE